MDLVRERARGIGSPTSDDLRRILRKIQYCVTDGLDFILETSHDTQDLAVRHQPWLILSALYPFLVKTSCNG